MSTADRFSRFQRTPAVLPTPVQHALQRREAKLGAEEVLSLGARFTPLCLYGVSRLLHTEGKLRRFPPVLRTHLWGNASMFAETAEDALADVSATVAMPKLTEHSRDLHATNEAYRSTALQYRSRLVYLLAHSTLVGVRSFAESHHHQFGVLFEPMPTQEAWTSIMIEPEEMVVSGLRDARLGPGNGVVLDDTEVTGTTRAAVLETFPGARFDTVG